MADLQTTPATTTSRTSNRLREKSQRRFSLPSRKEVLDSVAPDDKTPFKNYSDYQPRKLINNFVKERNTYNNPDRIDLFDEFSDEDFIDDNSSSDDDTSEEGSSSTTSDSNNNGVIKKPTSKRTKNQKQRSSTLKSQSDNESGSDLARPLKSHKHRLPADASSGSETNDAREEEFALAVRRRKRQRTVTISDSSSGSDDEQLKSDQEKLQDSCSPAKVKDQNNDLEGAGLPVISTQDLVHRPNVHAHKEVDNATNPADSTEDSDDSFIATDSSSDDVPDSEADTELMVQSNGPSHEELICNYRQKKRPRKMSHSQNKRRLHHPSSSSSADECQNEGTLDSDEKAAVHRPPSKRAERLQSKKLAWKSEVLGGYKNEREKRGNKKIVNHTETAL